MALPGFGQSSESSVAAKGSFFGSLTAPYRSRNLAGIGFNDSPRLEKLMRGGTIYLSLRDAVALALENNLDLEYARIGPKISESNLRRTLAGGTSQSGGSVVSSGAASAAGGTGVASTMSTLGAVSAAGSQIQSLDPVLTFSGSASHATVPQASSFTTGTSYLVSTSKQADVTYTQSFLTGTTVALTLTNTLGQRQNSIYNTISPSTSSSFGLKVSQNFLQSFGGGVNGRQIRIARNALKSSGLTFQQQVIATVTNVVSLYWDLRLYYDNLRIKQQAYELDRRLYEDNKRRAELGSLAPIETLQAEAEMKSAQQEVTNAEILVLQQEMSMKSVLTRSGVDHMDVVNARLVPVDSVTPPATETVAPIEALVAEAVRQRVELEQNRLSVENSRQSLIGSRNALLPTLTGYVKASNAGLAGDLTPVASQYGVSSSFAGGYGTVLDQIFTRKYPSYSAGVDLSITLRNRTAQENLATAELQFRQLQIQDKQQQNNLKLAVVNAQQTLLSARSAYETSVVARQLQDQTLTGVRRKYELGSSTILDVITAQRDAATRASSEATALNSYIKARLSLDSVLGRVLNRYEVQIDEAKSGLVKRDPDPIPATLPSGLNPSLMPPQPPVQ